MKCSLIFLNLLMIVFCISTFGQKKNSEIKGGKFSVNFTEASGFVIIPVSINGSQPLNFLLDTGSPYTIITNLDAFKYLELKKGESISIWGLGRDKRSLDAYLSKNNSVIFGKKEIKDSELILLFENDDLGGRFGIPVFGIVGYDILKDFVVKIDYRKGRITFYEHWFFDKRFNKSKYSKVNLEIEGKKPFVKLNSKINGKDYELRLLIDSAGTDALWLFEDDEKGIVPAELYIDDYLGFGLGGDIYGKRSRIERLDVGGYSVDFPTVSYPDSLSVAQVSRVMRNGSVGAELLKRFTTIYDYKNQKLYLKKNKYFKQKFYYNMAGLELYQPYPDLPYLEVSYVRDNSPAALAGLKTGDAVRIFNNKEIGLFNYNKFKSGAGNTDGNLISLVEINEIFRKEPGIKIVIQYTRGDSSFKRTAEFILTPSF